MFKKFKDRYNTTINVGDNILLPDYTDIVYKATIIGTPHFVRNYWQVKVVSKYGVRYLSENIISKSLVVNKEVIMFG